MQVAFYGRENAWFRTLYDQMLPRSMYQAVTLHGGLVEELSICSDVDYQVTLGVMLNKELKVSVLRNGFHAWG